MDKGRKILVADGGSTKVDWALIGGASDQIHNTAGLNPFVLSKEKIAEEIRNILLPQIASFVDDVTEIYFYGAGCSSKTNCNSVSEAISEVFPRPKVFVDHDMLGAVKALIGDESGVACILGTGANCCVYDGKKIVSSLNCLGHLAGDEGSGNHIGKQILQSYCYNTMPEDVREKFVEKYNSTPKEIVAQLYAAEKPNAYLAGYTRFLKELGNHEYASNILYYCFKEFVEKAILTQEFPKTDKIHFTGSVAFHFEGVLKEVLKQYGLKTGNIIKKPISGMINYHKQILIQG